MLNISNEVIVDVGCPSICYEYVLLPLVSKEAAMAGQNIAKQENYTVQGERRRNQADAT